MKNIQLFNVILMSLSFLMILTSFNTASSIQKVVVNSINEDFPNVNWNPYLSSCVLYLVYSLSNFIVPSLHTVFTYKKCFIFASINYIVYVACFLYPFKYSLIITSSLLGLSAAVLWTTQGNFLTENSTPATIDRNAGLFWLIHQNSLIFGNLYSYFQLQGVEKIKSNDRFNIYSVISIVCLIGGLLFLFIKKNPEPKIIPKDDENLEIIEATPLNALIRCFKLLKTKKMIYLSVCGFYSGLEQSFFNGIYPAVVGFTAVFGADSVKYSGLTGMVAGVGAVSGGILFGFILNRFGKKHRSFNYFIGFVAQILSFTLIWINHPNYSTVSMQEGNGLIEPQIWIAMLSGFLLCVGDACISTQLIAIIGTFYKDPVELSSAFALNRFTHSAGASLAFFYASFDITLYSHLIILIVFNILNFISFYIADLLIKRNDNETKVIVYKF